MRNGCSLPFIVPYSVGTKLQLVTLFLSPLSLSLSLFFHLPVRISLSYRSCHYQPFLSIKEQVKSRNGYKHCNTLATPHLIPCKLPEEFRLQTLPQILDPRVPPLVVGVAPVVVPERDDGLERVADQQGSAAGNAEHLTDAEII